MNEDNSGVSINRSLERATDYVFDVPETTVNDVSQIISGTAYLDWGNRGVTEAEARIGWFADDVDTDVVLQDENNKRVSVMEMHEELENLKKENILIKKELSDIRDKLKFLMEV
jgi:2-keto-3-deoxy-L-rhamnonate aldolase RhmA